MAAENDCSLSLGTIVNAEIVGVPPPVGTATFALLNAATS